MKSNRHVGTEGVRGSNKRLDHGGEELDTYLRKYSPLKKKNQNEQYEYLMHVRRANLESCFRYDKQNNTVKHQNYDRIFSTRGFSLDRIFSTVHGVIFSTV